MVRSWTSLSRRRLVTGWLCEAGVAACVTLSAGVLAARLGGVGEAVIRAGALSATVALAVWFALVWRRRQSALSVVIGIDLRLNLRQQLSTAWEVVSRGVDPPLGHQLAARALRERIPRHPAASMPVQLSPWTRLLPAAAALVPLAAWVELPEAGSAMAVPGPAAPVERRLDPGVAAEGVALRAFARDMYARAQAESLPSAALFAERLDALGAGMAEGEVSRRGARAALGRLGTQIREAAGRALDSAGSLHAWPGSPLPGGGSFGEARRLHGRLQEISIGRLLRRLEEAASNPVDTPRGERRAPDLEPVRRALEDLFENLGRPLPENVASALAGGAKPVAALRGWLRSLVRLRQWTGEAVALQDAAARSDALGRRLEDGRPAAGDRSGSRSDLPSGAEAFGLEGPAEDSLSQELGENPKSPAEGAAARGVSAPERSVSDPSPFVPAARVVPVRGRLEDTLVISSAARVLPDGAGVPAPPDDGPLSPRYRRQWEAVVANEAIPPSRRALVRRYFLALAALSESDRNFETESRSLSARPSR